jgi:hypothetical protein
MADATPPPAASAGPPRPPRGPLAPDETNTLSLERSSTAWLDRGLPKHTRGFLIAVGALAGAAWLAGFLLAADRGRFLRSRDWIAQPFYLAVHLIVLRLFVTAYTRHFFAGIAYLDMSPESARRRVHWILGPIGFLLALAIAAPFAIEDLRYLHGSDFLTSGDSQGGDSPAAADLALATLWTFEWVVNAYVWVLLVGFLVLTMGILKRHGFRASLSVVLHERHYRPFLMMSAQGASILLGFSGAIAIYVAVTHGETTDYVGLWVTTGLLLCGFVPPWMRLKNRVARQVRDETHRLGGDVLAAQRAHGLIDDRRPPVTMEELGARVDVVLAILQVEHLERLYKDLGRSEGQAILVRLLAPIATVLMRILRPG